MQHHLVRRAFKISTECHFLLQRRCATTTHNNFHTSTTSVSATTTAEPEESQLLCAKSPDQHTVADLQKIYTIQESLRTERLGPAVPKYFAHLSNAIHETSVLIRSPALQCMEMIDAAAMDGTGPAKMMLHGPRGGGKSLTLLHLLHYAMLKEMVLLYVPNPYFFVRDHTNVLLKSSWKATRYDQPNMAKRWLDVFRSMNANFLRNTTTSREYKWGKRDATPQGKTLMQLLDQGSSRDSYLTDAVGILLREIRTNEALNVMFAVDACNGLFTSETKYEEVEDPRDLALVEMFQKLTRPEFTLKQGAYVFATSRSVQYYKPPIALTEKNEPDSLERFLDGAAREHLADFTHVDVPNYSKEEYETMMNFYNSVGWLARDNTEDVIKQVDFLTYRNPFAVQQILRTL